MLWPSVATDRQRLGKPGKAIVRPNAIAMPSERERERERESGRETGWREREGGGRLLAATEDIRSDERNSREDCDPRKSWPAEGKPLYSISSRGPENVFIREWKRGRARGPCQTSRARLNASFCPHRNGWLGGGGGGDAGGDGGGDAVSP
jgi:hypothetical protein